MTTATLNPLSSENDVPNARVALTGAASVNSKHLLRGARMVNVLHRGEHYVLRETRGGKLILTK